MSDERTTIQLQHPIEFGKETIEVLEFRKGRFGDLKGITAGASGIDLDDMMKIVSRLSGKPIGAIAKLHEDDGAEVMAIALNFYGRFLGGGSEP